MQNNSEEKLTYLPEDSLASRSVTQAGVKGHRMTDISGRRCLELYKKFSRHGSSLRMFTESLIGTMDWYSSRSILTWKLLATKSKRSYCQLAVSMRHTDATGSGLLPTRITMDASGATAKMKSTQVKLGSLTLSRWAAMFPTPTARDWKGARNPKTLQRVGRKPSNSLPDFVCAATGAHGQLNPRFVVEMMGFPLNWTELPFQNGDGRQ